MSYFSWHSNTLTIVFQGRAKFLGYESAAGRRVREAKQRRENGENLDQKVTSQVADADREGLEDTGHHGISTLSRNPVPSTLDYGDEKD